MIEQRVQSRFAPGQRIRVIKRVRFQQNVHAVIVEGRFLEQRHVRTESSFAQGRHGHYWVDEVMLQKDDGEQSILMIDPWTRIEPLEELASAAGMPQAVPPVTPTADQPKGEPTSPSPGMRIDGGQQ